MCLLGPSAQPPLLLQHLAQPWSDIPILQMGGAEPTGAENRGVGAGRQTQGGPGGPPCPHSLPGSRMMRKTQGRRFAAIKRVWEANIFTAKPQVSFSWDFSEPLSVQLQEGETGFSVSLAHSTSLLRVKHLMGLTLHKTCLRTGKRMRSVPMSTHHVPGADSETIPPRTPRSCSPTLSAACFISPSQCPA